MKKVRINEIIDLMKSKDISYDLFFSRKLKTGYESFAPNIDKQIYDDLSNLILNNLKKFENFEQVKYNPTGYRENTLEICNCDYVGNYSEITESFLRAETVETEIDPDNFSFYCFVVKSKENDREVKFYRRVTKFKKLSTKGIVARLLGNTLNKMESKLIGIDGELDIIVYEDNILILSHYSLERVFSLQDKFYDNAKKFLEEINSKPLIENFEEFEEDCLNDGRFTKTLTKMSDEKIYIDKLYDKIENIKKTIDMFELGIKIIDFKIIYEEKNQINDILRILRDCYYISMINEEKGVDNRI